VVFVPDIFAYIQRSLLLRVWLEGRAGNLKPSNRSWPTLPAAALVSAGRFPHAACPHGLRAAFRDAHFAWRSTIDTDSVAIIRAAPIKFASTVTSNRRPW